MPDLVDNIMDAVGSKDTSLREKIKREFDSLIAYGVPPEQAKDTLMKKYARSMEKKIADLSGDESRVSLVARVASLNEREVTAKGEKKKVYFGFLDDETGHCSYSMWQEPNFKAGDTIRISNAYITTWNETKRVNIRSAQDVSISQETIEVKREARAIKIRETETYRGRAKIVCRILALRDFENSGIKVFRGTVGDDTGCALISFWKDFGVKENDAVEINGATVTQPYSISVSESAEVRKTQSDVRVSPLRVSQVQLNFRGVPVVGRVFSLAKGGTTRGLMTDGKKALPFVSWKSSEFEEGDVIVAKDCNVRQYLSTMRIDINGETERIKDPELESVVLEERISSIAEAEGMATVEGFIIDLKRDGSGLLRRCPQCNRVLTDMRCQLHSTVTEPRIDLRIKAVIDDGSDSATIILNRAISENLLGKTMEEYIEAAKRALDPNIVLDDCEKILFRPYRAKGIFRSDEFGKTLIATAIVLTGTNVSEEAERIMEAYQ